MDRELAEAFADCLLNDRVALLTAVLGRERMQEMVRELLASVPPSEEPR